MIKALLASEERTAIERWCRDRAMAVPLAEGLTLCRVLGEYKMVVDLGDQSLAPHLAMDGYWELWNAMCLAKRVKPGWRVIDVGACFGYFTLLLADLVGEGGLVEAWEPSFRVREHCLEPTLAMNGSKVNVVGAAASDEMRHRAALTYEDHRRIGDGRIRVDMDGPVKTLRLDAAPLDAARGRVDFVKIDAEGHEPEIWQGMAGLFARKEPRTMLMEWSPHRYADPEKFLATIRETGFAVGIVDGAGKVQPPVGDITKHTDGHLDLWLDRL